MFFGTRAYEKDMALRWGKKNNIDVTTSTELLSVDTVDQLKDYDGVTTMQFGKLEPEVYPKLESYGIKQISHIMFVHYRQYGNFLGNHQIYFQLLELYFLHIF